MAERGNGSGTDCAGVIGLDRGALRGCERHELLRRQNRKLDRGERSDLPGAQIRKLVGRQCQACCRAEPFDGAQGRDLRWVDSGNDGSAEAAYLRWAKARELRRGECAVRAQGERLDLRNGEPEDLRGAQGARECRDLAVGQGGHLRGREPGNRVCAERLHRDNCAELVGGEASRIQRPEGGYLAVAERRHLSG